MFKSQSWFHVYSYTFYILGLGVYNGSENWKPESSVYKLYNAELNRGFLKTKTKILTLKYDSETNKLFLNFSLM